MNLIDALKNFKFVTNPSRLDFVMWDKNEECFYTTNLVGHPHDDFYFSKEDILRTDWMGVNVIPKEGISLGFLHRLMSDALYPQQLNKFLSEEPPSKKKSNVK